MGFGTLWTSIKNLMQLPTSLYAYASSINNDIEKRQDVIADYWFGRILCTALLILIYYVSNEFYYMNSDYIPRIFDPHTGMINKWGIPFVLFICYIIWKIFIEVEFTHATHLSKIPNQPPRFFLLGHSYSKLRQLLKCNFKRYYGNYELELNMNADDSLKNNNNSSNSNNDTMAPANSINKSKVGISCYWENAWKPIVTLSSPDKINRIMMMNPENAFEARHFCPFKKLTIIEGNSGIMNEDGTYWKTTREQLEKPFNNFINNPNMKEKCLTSINLEMKKKLIDVLNKCSKQMLSNGDLDIDKILNEMIFNIIWNFIFDVDFDEDAVTNDSSSNSFKSYHTNTFRNAFMKCLEVSTYFKYNNETNYATKTLSNEFKTQFYAYIEKYEHNNENFHDANGNLKVMSLANIVLESEQVFSYWTRKQTLDNLLTVLVMGYQTTTIALKWTMYDLAQNKFYQDNIRVRYQAEERNAEVKSNNNDVVDANGIAYLRACIKESMRLHPPIPYFTRYLLKQINIGDYIIPAKTTVIISVYNIHRSLLVYGRDADNTTMYNPVENWIFRKAKRVPFSFLPYGGGSRNCIGIHVSQLILETVLSTLLCKFEFKTNIDRIYHKFDGYFCNLDSDLKLHFKRV